MDNNVLSCLILTYLKHSIVALLEGELLAQLQVFCSC